MTSRLRRTFVALGLMSTSLLSLVAIAPSPVSADPDLPLNWTVDAQTHVAGLNQDVSITGGTFVGSVDLATGEVVGDLSLPAATTQVKLLGIPLADTAFQVAQTAPASGTVNLTTFEITLTSSFNIKIPYLRPTIFPINLVGNNCQTATPITLTMTGTVDLVNGTTLGGEFTIPKFKNCGLLTTPALNLIVPGDGNTFTATAKPAA